MLCVMGCENPLEANVTIGSLYKQTNHKILRINLCTKPKDCSDSELSDATDKPLSPNTFNVPESATHASSSSLHSSSSSLVSSGPVKIPLTSTLSFTCSSLQTTATLQATPASETSGQPQSINLSCPDDEVIFLRCDTNISFDDLADTLIYSPLHVNADQPTTVVVTTVNADSPQPVTSNSQLSSGANTVFENQTEAAVVAEMEGHVIPIVDSDPASTSTSDFFANPENIVKKQIIVIRQVHCVMDMVEAFTDKNILDNISFRRVLDHGELEAGVRSGIIRHCLSDFWTTFYATKTCGRTYKIPTLHHTYQERESGQLLLVSWPLDGSDSSTSQSNLPLHSSQRLYHSAVQTAIYWRLSSTTSAQLRKMC